MLITIGKRTASIRLWISWWIQDLTGRNPTNLLYPLRWWRRKQLEQNELKRREALENSYHKIKAHKNQDDFYDIKSFVLRALRNKDYHHKYIIDKYDFGKLGIEYEYSLLAGVGKDFNSDIHTLFAINGNIVPKYIQEEIIHLKKSGVSFEAISNHLETFWIFRK